MLFLATAPCFLTFCSSDQSLLLFKFKIFVLNTIGNLAYGYENNYESRLIDNVIIQNT